MSEILLTVEEFAIRTHQHPETVRRQLRAGKIPTVRPGKKYLIPESVATNAALVTGIETSISDDKRRAAIDQGFGFLKSNQETSQADLIWHDMTSGEKGRHNAAIVALSQAPADVRAIIAQRSKEAAARYYSTPEGKEELADWRALDGEPFHDDEGDGDDL